MSLPKINFQSKESILQSFGEIAETIGKEIQLQVNDAYYRLVDFEFYPYAKEFPDPHKKKMVCNFNSAHFIRMLLVLILHLVTE